MLDFYGLKSGRGIYFWHVSSKEFGEKFDQEKGHDYEQNCRYDGHDNQNYDEG